MATTRPDAAPDPAASPPAPNLPARNPDRLRVLAARALSRRCPYCGATGIFDGWFTLKDACPTCGTSYEREDGYFLGAYAINIVVSETVALGLALFLIFGTRFREAPLLWQEALAISLAVGAPLLFFPFSRTVWIALDLLLDPPAATPERRLRGHEVGRPPDRPA